MTTTRRQLAITTALLALLGCDARSVGETYDRTCNEPGDCRVVHHATCSCSCSALAISDDENDRFVADNEAFCIFPQPPCEVCQPIAADCVDNLCVSFDCVDDANSDDRVEICRTTTGFVNP